jgi:phosphatidylserine decarboxylase
VYYTDKKIHTINYNTDDNQQQVFIQQGEEVGFFELGSTVIVLFDKNNQEWNQAMNVNNSVKVNQVLTNSKN